MMKQLKMKVSLRRKIHIMAFPQVAVLKARWSEDQSEATLRRPTVGPSTRSGSLIAVSSMRQEQCEQHQPDQQQRMPVGGAKIDAQAERGVVLSRRRAPDRPRERDEAADDVQAVQGGEEIEEGGGRIAGDDDARRRHGAPGDRLPEQEG